MTVIFVHIPKTGGTSVRRALGEKASLAAHEPLHKISAVKDDSRILTVVRNPYDRMLSMYNHFLSNPRKFVNKAAKHMKREEAEEQLREAKDKGFEYWLENVDYNRMRSLGDRRLQDIPQMDWLNGIFDHDNLILYCENLDNSSPVLSRWLGHEVWIRHHNQGKRRQVEMTPRAREFIAETFRPDFETFGYKR